MCFRALRPFYHWGGLEKAKAEKAKQLYRALR